MELESQVELLLTSKGKGGGNWHSGPGKGSGPR